MKSSKTIAQKILAGVLAGFIGLSAATLSAQDSAKLAAANTGFAFDLLRQITKEQPDKNIFISPFSVSTALQMVGDGAAGEYEKGNAARIENGWLGIGGTECGLQKLEPILEFAARRNFESGQWNLVSRGVSLEARFYCP